MSSKDPRQLREQISREAESRPQQWQPPNALPDPHQRPGIVHRWVRTASMGQIDPVNYSQSIREGWTPVVAGEYPELKVMSDQNSRWPDGIEVGGLLLCSAPAELMRQRQEYYLTMARTQMKSVNDQLLAEEDPRMRTLYRQHSSSVTRGFGPNTRREPGPTPTES
ncbi:MAG TPA: hypothetical protein VI455_02180 [Terriglobia bacterium]